MELLTQIVILSRSGSPRRARLRPPPAPGRRDEVRAVAGAGDDPGVEGPVRRLLWAEAEARRRRPGEERAPGPGSHRRGKD